MADSIRHFGHQAAYIAQQATALSKALLGSDYKPAEEPKDANKKLTDLLLKMDRSIERLDERMDELERKFEEFEQTSNYHLVLARKPEGM